MQRSLSEWAHIHIRENYKTNHHVLSNSAGESGILLLRRSLKLVCTFHDFQASGMVYQAENVFRSTANVFLMNLAKSLWCFRREVSRIRQWHQSLICNDCSYTNGNPLVPGSAERSVAATAVLAKPALCPPVSSSAVTSLCVWDLCLLIDVIRSSMARDFRNQLCLLNNEAAIAASTPGKHHIRKSVWSKMQKLIVLSSLAWDTSDVPNDVIIIYICEYSNG